MSASGSHSALVLELAEEFLDRYRQGQRPSLKEYIDRHPSLAAEIKEVFPAMAMMENIALADESVAGDATGPTTAAVAAMPEQLGDFRILREVGRGGMGIVYEAGQVSLGRHVALKVLPRQVLLDATQKRRFEREARAAAKLHHTNIVPVFGVGEHDGLPYYVMQFIQGLGLDEVLDELKRLKSGGNPSATGGELRVSRKAVSAADVARSLLTGGFHATSDDADSPEPAADAAGAPGSGTSKLSDSFTLSSPLTRPASRLQGKKPTYWQSVAQIGLQVADALEYAHKQGILHRDIKPSNLLLDTRGTVWVTDFGLARAEAEDHLTQTGDIVGTLRYMPPEMFEGRSDKRGDIYSLGLTLYELLARQPAYAERDRHRLIKRVTTEDPSRLDKLNRAIPRDLATIVHKAIDREPLRRYATAGELAADLQRFIEDEPIHARRVSVVERIGRWYRHNPTLAALTATLVLVFLAGFIGIAWKWRDAERQKDIAEDAEGRETAQRIEAEAQAERSRRLLYASDMNLVGQAWEAGEIGRVRDLLERQQLHEDLHGFEWRYLRNLCRDGSRLTLRGHTGPVSSVAFSPDGRTLVTIGQDQTVRLWDLASRQHVKLATQAGYAAFSPDSKILALASRQEVRFWDVVAKCERANFMHPGGVNALAFSPDSKLLATCCWDQTIRIWNVATRQVDLLAGHSGPVWCLAFSPDGKILATGSMDTTVRLWDVAARRVLTTCEGHLDWVRFLFFSPDGKTLSSASMDSVRLWDAVTGQPLKTLRKYRTEVVPTAFSPDGKTVATGDTAGMIRIWDARMKGGTALLRGHFSAVLALTFSPNGRSLVSGGWDGTVKVWDVAPGPDPNILTGHKAWLSSLALSADGKTLAVGDADERENTVKLWDLASRRPSGILRGHKRAVHCLAFAPRGQVLATGSDDKTVRLWDVANKKQLHEFQHDASVYSVAFSPDGKFLAASNQNESALVWDLAAKQKVAQLSQAYRVRFSPDGKLLASAWHKTTRLWDVATWQNVATLEEKNPGGLPDRLGEAGEPESGAPGRRLQGDIMSLAFAPDGRTLATRDGGGILRLWDVAGKRQIASTRGHTLARLASSAGCVTYSPDGRRLATGGGDSLVKLWDAASLQEVATLTGHDGPVYGVAFTPDGNTLVTASGDSTVRLWQAPPLARIPREPADAPALAPIEIIRLFWLETYGTAAATRSVEGNSQRVDVTAVDDTNWHAMLMQRFDDLQEGATYTIRFRAKANAPRPLTVGGIIAEPDWHLIGLSETVSLTENWREYQCRFQAKGLAGANILQFIVGERKGTVWIADVTVTKGAK